MPQILALNKHKILQNGQIVLEKGIYKSSSGWNIGKGSYLLIFALQKGYLMLVS